VDPAALRPLLDPAAHPASVLQARGPRQALAHLGLAGGALDQVDLGGRQGRREREPGEAGARADVGDEPRRPQLRHLEPGEAVGDVLVESARLLPDRGGRVGLRGERLQQGGKPSRRLTRQPVAPRQRGQRFP
jgi:hypothetical protein